MKESRNSTKSSRERFLKDWKDKFPEASEKEILEIYDGISLPKRATAGSAGYDFFRSGGRKAGSGRDHHHSYGNTGGNERRVGAEMLSKKRAGL